MMILLLIALLLAAIVLVILTFVPLKTIAQFVKEDAPLTGFNLKDDYELKREDSPVRHDSEVEKLSAKLKEAKEELKRLGEELALAKGNEESARQELSRLKIAIEKDKSAEDNYKKGLDELKSKLVKKDEEYEKELSLNLNLNKALTEYKQRCEVLENEKNDYCDKLKILEAHNKAYKEELKKQGELMRQLNKQSEDSQWVSKKEYDALKEQLSKEKENNEKGLPGKS
jgi:chromosome segregation ATPase